MATSDELKKLNEEITKLRKELGKTSNKPFLSGEIEDARVALRGLKAELATLNSDLDYISTSFKNSVAELTKQNYYLSLSKSSLKGIVSIADKFLDIQKGNNELSKKEITNLKNKGDLYFRQLEFALKFSDLNKQEKVEIQSAIDAQTTFNKGLQDAIDFQDKINDNFGVKIFGSLNDVAKVIPGLGKLAPGFEEAAEAAKEATRANEIEEQLAKSSREALNNIGFDESVNRFRDKKTGKFISKEDVDKLKEAANPNLLNPTKEGFKALKSTILEAFKPLIGLEILKSLLQADKELVKIQRNLALSRIEAIGFRAELAEAAAASGNINVTTTALLNTFNAINKELGFQGKFNSQNLVTATRLLDVVGLTEQSTANLTAAAEIRGNLLEDEYKTILATSYELQRQTGVQFSNKEILEAVGQVTGQVRANLGANPAAIAEAVTQAKLFGAELDNIVGASKALLDFESSIRNELEAELLLGRNLSLERARLAALNGDQTVVAEELAKNAQDFNTFTKLNVIQQDALSSALGLQSDQLADILFKQEVQGKTAKELRALGKDELADRLEAQTLQDKFTKSVEKLKSVLVDVVSAFTPILDILGGALELVGKLIQGLNSISPALSGAAIGAATGAIFGPQGAIIGGAIGLAGGVINTSTSSTTLSSPSVSVESNQGALKKEVQGMRMAFEKYAEKGTELKVSATSFNNKQKVYAYSV